MPKVTTPKASTSRDNEGHAPYEKPDASTKDYSCVYPECGVSFKTSANLARHKWRHIPEEKLPQCPFENELGWRCPHRFRGRLELIKIHWMQDHIHRTPYPTNYKFPTFQEICKENNIDREHVLPSDSPLKYSSRTKTMLHQYILSKMMPRFHSSLSGFKKALKKSMPNNPEGRAALAKAKEEEAPKVVKQKSPLIIEEVVSTSHEQSGWETSQIASTSSAPTLTEPLDPLTLEQLGWDGSIQMPSSSSTLDPIDALLKDLGLAPGPADYYNTAPFSAPQPDILDFDALFNIQPNHNTLPFPTIGDEDWALLTSVAQSKAQWH